MDETKTKTEEPESEKPAGFDIARMPFMAHVAELRKRLMISAIAIGAGFGICYPFHERLLQFITDPLIKVLPQGQRLIYTSLPEAFFTYLKISFLAGLLLSLPVILYQIWLFIAPGLFKHERRYAFIFVLATTVLFLGGAVFGYRMVFPYGFKFFVGFESELIQPLPALKQYISFSMRLLLAFGLVFELPIVIAFLAKMGLVTDKLLRKNRKWAFLLMFVIGAMFTPPDVITQLLMAMPLMILFEISIYIAMVITRRREAAAQAEDGDQEEDEDQKEDEGQKEA